MSEFEKVHDELVSLGWTPVNGTGDHVKFTKPGNRRPITISRSLGSGRSFQNTIANIRKVEPQFKAGRKGTPKEKSGTDDVLPCTSALTAEEKAVVAFFSFLRVGEPVRYITPEGNDFAKLEEEGSVMSMRYVVKEILSTTGSAGSVAPTDKVVITDDGNSHELTVKADELVSWELQRCPECGRLLPQCSFAAYQVANGPSDRPFCVDCFIKALACASKMMKDIPGKTFDVGSPLSAKDEDEYELSPELRKELDRYKAIPVAYLPKELRERVHDEVLVMSERGLVSQRQKKTVDKVLKKWGVSDTPSSTPYECWKIFLQHVKFVMTKFGKDRGQSKAEISAQEKALSKCFYSIEHIGDLDVISITAVDHASAMAIMGCTGRLFQVFNDIYPDRKYCARIRCQKCDIDQYVSSIGFHYGVCDELRRVLDPVDFEKKCVVVRMLAGTVTYDEMNRVGQDVVDSLRMDGFIPDGKEPFVTFDTHLVGKKYEKEEGYDDGSSLDCFDMVPRIVFVVDDVADAELYGQMSVDAVRESIMRKVKTALGDDAEAALEPLSARSDKSGADEEYLLEPRKVFRHELPKTVTLNLPFTLWNRLEGLFLEDRSSDGRDFDDCVVDVLGRYCELMDGTSGEKAAAAGKEPVKENPKTENNMPEFSSLDANNPTSTVEAFKDVTTRELLRELKNRGVQFEGLSVPVVVRQNVNLDEI